METQQRSPSLGIEFIEKGYRNFDVELADVGNDIVYHFWPKKGFSDFPVGFGLFLEKAFQEVLPAAADVRAAYTSKEEAQLVMRYSDKEDEPKEPAPSFFVKVIDWADNPMSDRFLRADVLSTLDSFLE